MGIPAATTFPFSLFMLCSIVQITIMAACIVSQLRKKPRLNPDN